MRALKAPVVALVRRQAWSGSCASHPVALGFEFEAVRYCLWQYWAAAKLCGCQRVSGQPHGRLSGSRRADSFV